MVRTCDVALSREHEELMGAPRRVSDRAIVEAFQRWQGNLSAAASEVGIARQNFRERLRLLGFDIQGFRARVSLSLPSKHTGTVEAFRNVSTGPTGTERAGGPRAMSGKQHAGVIYSAESEEPIFGRVESMGSLPERPVRMPTVRLRPEQIEQLRDLKFDYQAKTRREVREEDLLRRFFDECFPEWLERITGKKKAKTQAQQQ
jgi:hypothetical protein